MNNTIRSLWFCLLAAITAGLLIFEWSRSRSLGSLRQDNELLRQQLSGIQVPLSEIEDLRALRDHLRHSIDAFAAENESLRTDNNALREQTNQLAQLRPRLINSEYKNERLAQGLRELQAELNAKPIPPRFGAWLGVGIRDLDQKRDPFSDRAGVIVTGVVYHSPADLARLQIGDRIFSVDGEVVANSQHFKNLLAQKPVRQLLALELARGDNLLTLAIKPNDWPQ